MRQALGPLIILLSIPWFANAGLEQSDQNQEIVKKFDELPQDARAVVVAHGLPELTRFLMHRVCAQATLEIPNFGANNHFCTLSPRGKLVILPDIRKADGTVPRMLIWDLCSQRLLHQVNNAWQLFKTAIITPDGNTVIVCSYKGEVSIWDLGTASQLHDLGTCCAKCLMALSADGSKLVTLNDHNFQLWDVHTGEVIADIMHNNFHISLSTHVAVSNDGSKVAFGSQAKSIYVWDVANNREFFALKFDGCEVRGLAFNHDETQLIGDVVKGGRSGNLIYRRYLWDMINGELLSKHDYDYQASIIDGKKIEYHQRNGRNFAELYDNQTGQLIMSFCYPITIMSVFNNNWLVCSVQDCKKIYAWNLDAVNSKKSALSNSFGLLSWRQVVLLELIKKAFDRGQKRLLDGNKPVMAGFIRDYVTLPHPIKKVVEERVKLINVLCS